MKNLKVLLVMLMLTMALVGCRVIPSEVAAQHGISMQESDEALELAKDTLKKVEAQSAELNDATVHAAFMKWTEHIERIMAARGVVHKYLIDTKAGVDVTGAYSTGHKLLTDMHRGFSSIKLYWDEMIKDGMKEPRERFLELFRYDIKRFRELERKFDEWISQFKVKG